MNFLAIALVILVAWVVFHPIPFGKWLRDVHQAFNGNVK